MSSAPRKRKGALCFVYTLSAWLSALPEYSPPHPPRRGGLVTTYHVVLFFFRKPLLPYVYKKTEQPLAYFYAELFKIEKLCYDVCMSRINSWHRLTEMDEITRVAVCSQCGPVAITLKGRKRGQRIFVCGKHRRDLSKGTKSKHRRGLDLSKCSECGFVAVSRKQIDVHHINGNHYDNTPSNLQVLCANCHRLKD